MKNIIMIFVGCLISISAFSQQNLYKWRLGIHGGLGTYYGDLSTGRVLDPQTDVLRFWDNKENLSYGLSLQGSMSDAWSFRLMSTIGSFQANDRATKWNGDAYTNSINYSRALNFRTSYYDVDGIFIYSFDNGSFFGEKSFFAPYIGIGVGYMNYKVKGDLYQEDGSRYHYWSDNTIRDIGESDPNAANAIIIEQDGNFETDLRSLETEGNTYGKSTLTIPLAMGLKFRLNDRINLNLETTLHYAFSDYLDDVSGEYPVLYNSLSQVYASNPSEVNRKTRGAGNKLNDIYGSFNLSIGYNFGYKKQGFNAPIFYLGESEPASPIIGESPIVIEKEETIIRPEEIEVEVIVKSEVDPIQNATIIIENATINQLNVDTIIQGTNQVKVIRDTVYEQGTLIHEKVIIRTDTIREIIQENIIIDNKTGDITPVEYEEEYVLLPMELEWDTLITLDPVTLQEDTVVYTYSGDVAVEEVPEEPVFTLETIEAIELEEITPVYFYENIGYLKDDLSEEEIMLSEVQESNFELIALRNEINELKIKDNKSQEDMDVLYEKLDELNAEYIKYERYNNSLAIQGNGDYNKPANIEIQKASNELAKDIENVRTEIIYLESPASSVNNVDYERIKKENDKRISSLEKEMRKLRKDVRKSKRDNLPPRVNNPSRLNDEKEVKETVVTTVPQTVIVDNNDPAKDLAYQLQIQKLEKELSILKSNNNQTNAVKDAELALLKTKLADLDRKINAVQTTGNTDSQTLTYITNLERKLDDLNSKLVTTQNDLVTLSNRPSPSPSTTTIITQPSTPRPAPAPQAQIIATTSPAKEAVNRLGKVNIYYGSGKSYIKTEFYNDLDRVIMLMKQYPGVTANLTGFTDKSGNPDANFRLSKKRSDTVAEYLMNRGISSSRISTNYYGDTQSSSVNDPYSRRVEVSLLAY